ncbi:unnamed protein product [Aphanomyces euteiches]|uniref:MAPEG family protein n=1 Tax=Aphanomyces euteiches TaxID=100861 RepID=A0A6G0W4K5_9STRA|nr:hypothetical protein Ae201684_018787 [Aphanomyces euteiches]KAH9089005.1 hypothetical protein Ae201684P_012292 [Aphanomyces euteiches]KAH9151764.1 hypothetical protein AeRB84_005693 [Aphanomyces euteiches]
MGSDNGTKVTDSGLPTLTDAEKTKNNSLPILLLCWPLPLAIGTAIASVVYMLGETATVEKRMQPFVENDLHWAALALVVLGNTITFVNGYPLMYKNQVMRRNLNNLRSNPSIYKAIGKYAIDNAIVLNDEGAIGAYNRANRSLHHMIENNGMLVAGLALASQVFAVPVFVTVCVFGVGRILHQVGYTSGYGGHSLGYILSMAAVATIQGFLFLIGLKGLNVL